ncbi:MAG: asparagine synthase (glutamine-hydrolyzing) [Bacteroidota bacterium]
MCGITGYWNVKGNNAADENILYSMASMIKHRGPDDEGYYFKEGIALAHKRLSILDLSQAGHQPMSSNDGRFIIVFNGEIYNYIELATELAKKGIRFKGNSDTEVLIECYRLYGEACLNMFNGMFAFVIWDNEKKEIFIARDRVGIKPLYYFLNSELFVFGSEIKAVTAHPKVYINYNTEAINNYLVFSHQLDDQTWFKDIFLLEPGNSLTINQNTVKKRCYWKPVVAVDYGRTYHSLKEELSEKIYDSIKLHQRSDVPVGAHLSGGIDSSAIVAIASKMTDKQFHTFSSTFSGLGKDFDENKEIDIVKNEFHTIHHQVSTNPELVMDILPHLIYLLDEPTAGPAILPMYFVNQLISKNKITVVNGGQGVDELFGGYKPSFTLAAHNLLTMMKNGQKVPFSEVMQIPQYLKKGGSFKRLFNRFSSAGYSIFDNKVNIKNAYKRYYDTVNSLSMGIMRFEQDMLMSLKFYLPALLHQEDRMSMAWSIESRVPFLDYRLVDYSMTIPSFYKVKNNTSKYIFREALRGVVPDEILANKVKRGYPTPISIWSKNQMAQFFRKNLININSDINEIVNMKNVELMLNDHLAGKRDYTSALWSVLCTKIWFDKNFN